MESYNEAEFRRRVDMALARVRKVLDHTRNPQYAADVPHQYDDKFALVEFMGRTTVAALDQCLETIGLAPKDLARLREWAATRAVTLRLSAREDCKFLREETKKVESATEYVTEKRGFLGNKSTKTEKVVTTVTEYFWSFEFDYTLDAYHSTAVDEGVQLLSRRGKIEIKTAANVTPRPQTVVRPAIEANISWLLRQIDDDGRARMAIDRTQSSCHTPRRNREVDAALVALDELNTFFVRLDRYFVDELFGAQSGHGLDLTAIHADDVVLPVLPLFEAAAADGSVLRSGFADELLGEQKRTLVARCQDIAKVFPRDASVITALEASLVAVSRHARQVCRQFFDGVAYVEQMLRNQLVAAIGKELSPADFAKYMEFHGRKLFRPEHRPLPFSHAIRRPEHDPEGTLSIEVKRGSSMAEPISTIVATSESTRPMFFALDASTRVAVHGQRHLHAWVSHQFSGSPSLALELVARARQFSSFILLVGRIAAADVFEPRFGVIVQNKDLLSIPLMLEQIPTPKEFRDAIESLSPEQQRFAKAFRGMQLESTLFGVCVIHIKPQLEKLLKLDPDSLTKQIKLTQELSSLFIDYQIPSDLLSYDGPRENPSSEKIARVNEYVARMREMINLSKQRELEEAREREAMRLAESNMTPYPMAAFAAPSAPIAGPPPPMRGGGGPGGAPYPSAPAMMPPPAPSAGPMMPAPSPPMQKSAAPPTSSSAPITNAPRSESTARPSEGRSRAQVQESAAKPPANIQANQQPAPRSTSERTDVATSDEHVDYTRIPAELDAKFDQLDDDGALRPTIINTGDVWSRTAQKGLLSEPESEVLDDDEQEREKHRAFDLLDALTKSGALAVDHASLHVVLAATHCFDKTLVDTVVKGNVNPIEKVERSLVIAATTVHRLPARALVAEDQHERFFSYAPKLALEDGTKAESADAPAGDGEDARDPNE
ncbi:MAG: hypothetical protein JNK05_38705 [Myxococcales bacterium]|nr:hypothetical protein [Myxococcales bacterium]